MAKKVCIRGQVAKVTTTADECVRLTIDIDVALIPPELNLIHWKNNMVNLTLAEGVERDEFFDN